MSIVKTDVPMTPERAEAAMAALAQRYPFIRLRALTKTHFGRPVLAMTLGSGPRTVLYTAAHHANEWITSPLLLQFAEEIAESAQNGSLYTTVPAREILEQATIHLVPMVDPDGVALVTGAIPEDDPQYQGARLLAERYPAIPFPEGWKANLLGVDLNLNYPAGWEQAKENKEALGYFYPGPRDFVGRSPLDQRETRALADYTEEIDPALILAYHTQGEVIYWKYQNVYVPGAKALAEAFAASSGYAAEDTPFASGFAGYKDWFIDVFRRPGFTIEAGLGRNPLPLAQLPEIYARSRGILATAALGIS